MSITEKNNNTITKIKEINKRYQKNKLNQCN